MHTLIGLPVYLASYLKAISAEVADSNALCVSMRYALRLEGLEMSQVSTYSFSF
jgi:hypothetical protein